MSQGKVLATKTQKVKNELLKLVESGEVIGLSQTQIGQKIGAHRRSVSKYLDEVYRSLDMEEINHITVSFAALFKKLFRETGSLLKSADTPMEKERAIKLYLALLSEKTEFLEKFHLKPKALENISVSGEMSADLYDGAKRKEFFKSVYDVITESLEEDVSDEVIKRIHERLICAQNEEKNV